MLPRQVKATKLKSVCQANLSEVIETARYAVLRGGVSVAGQYFLRQELIAQEAQTLQFGSQVYRVSEGVGTMILEVIRSRTSGACSVTYETSGGTAKAGVDYVSVKGVLKFKDGEASKQIEINIIDDDSPEPDEYFNVNLLDPKNCSLGEWAMAKVIIMDDDGGGASIVQFGSEVYKVSEGVGTMVVEVTRSRPSGPCSVAYETCGGTAKAGEDYVSVKGVLKFKDGESSKQISIDIIDDDAPEPDEYFNVRLFDAYDVDLGEWAMAKVIIMDDDGGGASIVQFGSEVYKVSEGVGTMVVEVVRSSAVGACSVVYETSGGTAVAGEDYVKANGALRFEDGEASKQIFIEIIDDDVPEPDEYFNVNLWSPDNCSLGEWATTKVVIMDDDGSSGGESTVQFGSEVYKVSEGVGTMVVEVVRSPPTGECAVSYETYGGTAKAGEDYVSASGVLLFQDGEASMQIRIEIIDDDAPEPDEFFQVSLFDAQSCSLGEWAAAKVIIMDNDGGGDPSPEAAELLQAPKKEKKDTKERSEKKAKKAKKAKKVRPPPPPTKTVAFGVTLAARSVEDFDAAARQAFVEATARRLGVRPDQVRGVDILLL